MTLSAGLTFPELEQPCFKNARPSSNGRNNLRVEWHVRPYLLGDYDSAGGGLMG